MITLVKHNEISFLSYFTKKIVGSHLVEEKEETYSKELVSG